MLGGVLDGGGVVMDLNNYWKAKALEEKCIKAGWKPIKHIWNIAHPLEPLIKKKASSLNKKLI